MAYTARGIELGEGQMNDCRHCRGAKTDNRQRRRSPGDTKTDDRQCSGKSEVGGDVQEKRRRITVDASREDG